MEKAVKTLIDKVVSTAYEFNPPNLKGRKLIFPNIYPVYKDMVTHNILSSTGKAKIIAKYDAYPKIGIKSNIVNSRSKEIGLAYDFTKKEISAAVREGFDLNVAQAREVKRHIMIEEDRIIWKGDKSHDLLGFILHPNSQRMAVSDTSRVDIKTDKKLWKNKTAHEIVHDITSVINLQKELSKDTEIANTLLLPPEHLSMIKSRPITDISDITIYKFIQDIFPELSVIESVSYLKDVVSEQDFQGVANVGIIYNRDEDAQQIHITEDFTQNVPEVVNTVTTFNCDLSIAGVSITKGLSVFNIHGI